MKYAAARGDSLRDAGLSDSRGAHSNEPHFIVVEAC